MPASRRFDGVQLQSLSPTHEAIAEYLIANPGKGCMARCAAEFNLTPHWLSSLVHSDAFQAYYRNRRDEFFATGIVSLGEKIAGAADRAIERLAEAIETEKETRTLADAADKLLNRLGYGATGAANSINTTVNNTYVVTSTLLQDARERAKKRGSTFDSDQTEELPALDGVSLGGLPAIPASVPCQAPEIDRGEKAREAIRGASAGVFEEKI